MAKFILVLVLVFYGAGHVSAQTDMIVGDMNHDGHITIEDVTLLASTLLGERDIEHQVYLDSDAHECVDLGLPSGTLWATCNVGANSPEEFGDYFAWGEVKPKRNYSWAQYKWMKEGYTSIKGCSEYTFADGNTSACWYENGEYIGKNNKILEPVDDAAYMNWGVAWRMPSPAQIEELCDSRYTTSKWTKQNNVEGRLVTSKINGATLFLPAAGYYGGTTLYNNGGSYWTLSLGDYGSYSAFLLDFGVSAMGKNEASRSYGYPVRAVRPKSNAE